MDNVFIKKEELNSCITRHLPNKDLISIDDLIGAIEDLDSEVNEWEMKYDDLYNDLQDNYKPISQAEQYEVSEGDFY